MTSKQTYESQSYAFSITGPIIEGLSTLPKDYEGTAQDLLNDKLFKGNIYFNKLTEVNQNTKDAEEKLYSTLSSEYREVQKKINDIQSQWSECQKEINLAKSRCHLGELNKEQRDEIITELEQKKKCLPSLAPLFSESTKLRNAIRKNHKTQFDNIKSQRTQNVTLTRRSHAGGGILPSKSYLQVERAIEAQYGAILKKFKARARFKRFDGTGSFRSEPYKSKKFSTLGVDALFVKNDLVSIGRVNKTIKKKDIKFLTMDDIDFVGTQDEFFQGNKKGYGVLFFNIVSDTKTKKDKLFTVAYPIRIDRRLPEGCDIREVTLSFTEGTVRNNVDLLVGFRINPDLLYPEKKEIKTVAGIDLGWRLDPETGNIKMGWVYFSDGVNYPLVLKGTETVNGVKKYYNKSRWDHSSSIKGYCDDEFNRIKKSINDFKKQHEFMLKVHAPWFCEEASHIHQWKSYDRVYKFYRMMKENRFEGDQDLYDEISAWIHGDNHLEDKRFGYHGNRHLSQFQKYEMKKAVNQRKAEIQNLVKEIVEKADLVKIENLAIINMNVGTSAKQFAAPKQFVDRLISSAKKAGTTVAEVNKNNTTKTCHRCGSKKCTEGMKSNESYTCSDTGEVFDRDYNAAINIMNSAVLNIVEPAPTKSDKKKV